MKRPARPVSELFAAPAGAAPASRHKPTVSILFFPYAGGVQALYTVKDPAGEDTHPTEAILRYQGSGAKARRALTASIVNEESARRGRPCVVGDCAISRG